MVSFLHLQKITIIFSLLLFASVQSWASIAPNVTTELYEHLYEVNKEWAKQAVDLEEICMPTSFKNDTKRIQTHLMLVEQHLRAKNIDHLNVAQQQNRIHQLDVLKQYWQEGLFPKNTKHQNRQPYFVDDFGTACAVGHLVLESGASDLVQRIRQENNFAYLRDMDYPELTRWATTNGFTLDELAWIQPAYVTWDFNSVGNNGGSNGRIHAMKSDENKLYIAGDFTSFDGIAANGIIAWDGDNYQTMEGLNGIVYDLEFYQNELWAVGDFTIDGSNDENIAAWNGNQWVSKGTGDMDGPVYDVHVNYYLFVGGDFNMIGDLAVSNIASWHNFQDTWRDFYGSLAVDGPVYCMESVNNDLLIGGDYTQVNINTGFDPINANHLAYWNLDNWDWSGALNGPNAAVHALKYYNGDVYIGSDLNEGIGYYVITGGLWKSPEDEWINPVDDGIIHNFVEYNNRLFIVGGFYMQSTMINGFPGSGFGTVFQEQFGGYAEINKTVRAAASFKDQLYFAGDFTEIWGNSLNQLAVLALPTVMVDPLPQTALEVKHYDQILEIRHNAEHSDIAIQVFDMSGRLVLEKNIEDKNAITRTSTSHLTNGTYVYHVINNGERKVGKFVSF